MVCCSFKARYSVNHVNSKVEEETLACVEIFFFKNASKCWNIKCRRVFKWKVIVREEAV